MEEREENSEERARGDATRMRRMAGASRGDEGAGGRVMQRSEEETRSSTRTGALRGSMKGSVRSGDASTTIWIVIMAEASGAKNSMRQGSAPTSSVPRCTGGKLISREAKIDYGKTK